MSRGGGVSEFGRQLAMKQKIKRIYGVMERQFRKHFEDVRKRSGVAGDLLIARLEMRLDNVAYRAGLGASRSLSRQLVKHGALKINGKKVDVPSYEVKVGDEVSISDTKKEKNYFIGQISLLKNRKDFPSWLQFDKEKVTWKISGIPTKQEAEGNIDPQLVVEYYSR